MFVEYYRPLTVFAVYYVKDLDTAREIVQDFFVRLWESGRDLSIHNSVKGYLYQSIKNCCYNHLNTSHKRLETGGDFPVIAVENDVIEQMAEVEVREKLYRAIETLPGKCREIFILSRIRQFRHGEIARMLAISEKTVENQIGIALKKLSMLKNLMVWFFLAFPFSC